MLEIVCLDDRWHELLRVGRGHIWDPYDTVFSRNPVIGATYKKLQNPVRFKKHHSVISR